MLALKNNNNLSLPQEFLVMYSYTHAFPEPGTNIAQYY